MRCLLAPFDAELTTFAYVEARDGSGQVRWGVGIDTSILTASLRAVLSAAVLLVRERREDAKGAVSAV